MKCALCRGVLKPGAAPFSVTRKGYHALWDAVHAWVCSQCGEAYFEAHEVEAIQRAMAALDNESAGLHKAGG